MPKKSKAGAKMIRTSFSLDDLEKVLFTKDDAVVMEQKINEKFAGLERTLSEKANKSDLEALATKIDLDRIEQKINHLEKQVTPVIYKEHSPKLDDHEKRITHLEKVISPN